MTTLRQSLGTRKQREAKDIIDAAIEQGWRLDDSGGRTSNHLKLVPPNFGVPVGISCTPSDKNWRHQVIRLMRRSGFIWPPPDKKETTMIIEHEPIEEWRPIVHCRADISNGGMVRHSVTKKIIKPLENGIVRVLNEAGFSCEKSVRGECRKAFGYPPIKALYHPERFDASVPLPAPQEPAAPLNQDHWQPVLIEGVREGYEVNERAQVLAFKNPKSRERKLVQIYPSSRGSRVLLRLTDNRQRRYLLDEIVLEAFEARPGTHWSPEHIDGDPNNCVRSNLRWKEGNKPMESTTNTTVSGDAITSDASTLEDPEEPITPLDQSIPDRAGEDVVLMTDKAFFQTIKKIAPPDEIVSYHVHVYEHLVSGLQLKVTGDQVTLPEVTLEQLPILAALLAEHQK